MTTTILPAAAVTALHDALLAHPGWPDDAPLSTGDDGGGAGADAGAGGAWHWVRANHRCNSRLWAEEDLARRTTVVDSEIAANKRAIDRHNQARNDATERIDELLLLELRLVDSASARTDAPLASAPPGARLHSETAGAMVDRLSILALKIQAMWLQQQRADAAAEHRDAAAVRLARLLQQRSDLAGCLDALLADAAVGRAYFKVYRQFKMYNDPRFNPVLVAEGSAAAAASAVHDTGVRSDGG